MRKLIDEIRTAPNGTEQGMLQHLPVVNERIVNIESDLERSGQTLRSGQVPVGTVMVPPRSFGNAADDAERVASHLGDGSGADPARLVHASLAQEGTASRRNRRVLVTSMTRAWSGSSRRSTPSRSRSSAWAKSQRYQAKVLAEANLMPALGAAQRAAEPIRVQEYEGLRERRPRAESQTESLDLEDLRTRPLCASGRLRLPVRHSVLVRFTPRGQTMQIRRLFVAIAVAVAATRPTDEVAAQGGRAATPPRDPMQEGLPLDPTRTATFTTKVGHWMSVDVSPDGQTLVFDLLGDLYTMPSSGGKATPLTRGMAFDAQPRFSPDGKHIVFVSDRDGGWNLWTIAVDKTDTTQLTRGKTNTYYSPDYTPDGKYIVATKDTKLWMYHVDGGRDSN